MYTAHFGLEANPFSLTPDPAYLYLSPYHQEALAHLLYGMGEDGGFVLLTGEVGTGKTMLIRTLMEQQHEPVDIALCLNPRLTEQELVAVICDELRIGYPRQDCSLKILLDALNTHLLATHAQGRRTVLIIDEAQNLSHEVLEQVRLLTNLETRRCKLLRVILVGQPELQRLLAGPELRQLAQRITARYHLMPLNRKQTAAYIAHRLQVAGGGPELFTSAAVKTVYRLTGGVPRLINIICDRALLGTYSRGLKQVNARLLRRAAREVLLQPVQKPGFRFRLALELVALGALAVAAAQLYLPGLLTTLPLPAWVASYLPDRPAVSTPPARVTVAATPATVAATPDKIAALFDKAADEPIARLLALWGADARIPAGQSPCEYAQSHSLRCLSGRADWQELRRYNRPAVLQLKSPQGDKRQILLKSLTGETATLEVAGRLLEIPLTQLQSWWTGDYLMFWRPQTSLTFIGPGSSGEPVVWLRRRLAMAEGQEPPAGQDFSAVFDPALAEQVRNFQRTHALQEDGVVGQRTMALLDNLAPAPGTPVLTAPALTKVN